MENHEKDTKSADYLYMVCREYPLLVISTESGVGKYHFSSIGFKQNRMLIEFNLIWIMIILILNLFKTILEVNII